MSRRGVLYLVWEQAGGSRLERSLTSLAQVHPELPHHVVNLPPSSRPIEKAQLYGHSPFETTLFLDTDTVVLGRLDYGFEMAERFGLACCLSANPWRRRYAGVVGDEIEYDTGALFFDAKAAPVFEAWNRLAPNLEATVVFQQDGKVQQAPCDDRLSFARAVELCAVAPFVLPHNWNFRPVCHHSCFGPIKIWHGDEAVPETVLTFNRYYERPDAIMQFHELR